MKSQLYNEQKEQDLKQNIATFTSNIENEQNNPSLYFKRALLFYQLSQQYYDISEKFEKYGDKDLYFKYVRQAYVDIEKALSFNEEIEDYALTFRLLMLKKLKKWDKLISYANKLNRENNPSEDFLLGEASYHVNDWANCIKYYSELIKKVGMEKVKGYGIKIFVERGLSYYYEKKYDVALNDFLIYSQLNDKHIFDSYSNKLIAMAYNKLSNYSEAISYYSYAIENDNHSANLYYERGKIYCDKLKKYLSAIRDFTKAIEFSNEENPFYFHYLGYANVHQGQIEENNNNYKQAYTHYEKAIEAYKKEVVLNKSNDDGRFTVGYAIDLKNELLKKIK